MIRETGNMWNMYEEADHFFITTNSYVKTNGCAVLGRGIALEAKNQYPTLSRKAGNAIEAYCGHHGSYGILPNVLGKIGLFQVKYGWSEAAQINLIIKSTNELGTLLRNNPDIKKVALNMPGIGNGKLNIRNVLPIVEILPDSVHIWTFK